MYLRFVLSKVWGITEIEKYGALIKLFYTGNLKRTDEINKRVRKAMVKETFDTSAEIVTFVTERLRNKIKPPLENLDYNAPQYRPPPKTKQQ